MRKRLLHAVCYSWLGLLAWLLGLSPQLAAAQSNTPPGPPQVPLGTAASYALLSGGKLQATCPVQAFGRVGAADSLLIPALYVSDTAFTLGGGNVGQALLDLAAARSYCSNLGGSAITALAGQQLGGGVYSLTGNAALAAGDTLTLVGDTSTVVVLNISGNLSLAGNSVVRLQGVSPRKVFWNVGQQLSLGSLANAPGVLMAGGAVSVQGLRAGRRSVLSVAGIRLSDPLNVGEGNLFVALGPGPDDPFDPPVVPPPVGYTPQSGYCNLVQDGSFECFPFCINSPNGFNISQSFASYWSLLGQVRLGNPVLLGQYYHEPNTQGTVGRLFNACASTINYALLGTYSSLWRSQGVPYNNFNTYGLEYTANPVGVGYIKRTATSQPLPAMAQHSLDLTGGGYAAIRAGVKALLTFSPCDSNYPYTTATISSYSDERDYLYQQLSAIPDPSRRYYAEFYYAISPNSTRKAVSLGLALCPNTPPARVSTPTGRMPLTPVVQGTPLDTYPT